MKLNELLEIVHRAYPDEHTRRCWDAKKRKVRTGTGDTLADHRRIDALVRKHLPELFQGLALNLRNPYRYYKTRRHLILVHSGIEHFLAYSRRSPGNQPH